MCQINWVPTKKYFDFSDYFTTTDMNRYITSYSLVDQVKNLVTHTKQKYSVRYKLPGIKKENVNITYENDFVTVKVEQKEVVSFNYIDTFDLSFIPKTFDAKMEDGLLTLEITPEKIEPLTIEIK